jgi:hypothetical protein
MADEKKPAEDASPEEHAEYQRAKKGVVDSGHIVKGALDEPLSGTVADIADGDSAPHHPHKAP